MFNHKKLWVTLTSVFGALTVLFLVVTLLAVNVFANLLNVNLKATTYKIVGGDSSVEYYKSAYSNSSELSAYEQQLCEELEGEGAVLLKNDGNTLPLGANSKVSLFSHSSVDIIYGGTGSGSMNVKNPATLRSALEAVDISVNDKLWDFYSNAGSQYTRVNPATTGGYTKDYKLNEVPWTNLTDTVTSSFASFGDAAIVVLARSGGEGSDLPFGNNVSGCKEGCADATDGDYLVLSPDEKKIFEELQKLKNAGTFKKIIVLLNYSNAMQLDFLDSYGIDAALWIGDVGQTGINAVGKIISGDIIPSGRLVDTFLKDNHSSPAMANFGVFEYSDKEERGLDTPQNNTESGSPDKGNSRYLVYLENIYVGYRYYETRYEDYVLGIGNAGEYNYDADVAYPFGYGASYNNFTYSNFTGTRNEDGDYEFTVSVKNEGSKAAKHTVQLYFQSPYTEYDKEHGIEKASVELCGFDKKEIAGGATETYEITVAQSELRTYDSDEAKTYILDAGTYYFTVGTDAHNAINNILMAKSADTSRMSGTGSSEFVKTFKVAERDTTIFATAEATGKEITNQFDNADLNKYTDANKSVTYLSRSDWTGTWPTVVSNFKVSEQMWADGLAPDGTSERAALVEKYKQDYWKDATLPTTDANIRLQLIQYRGLGYDESYVDDEGVSHTWDELLDQLSYDEITNVIGDAFHVTNAAASIGLPATKDENGPQGFTLTLAGGDSGMAYTSEDVMAATYNLELIERMGECIGEDCLLASNAKVKYSGLYGPATNIHRTPYSGRNFEYYSEDSFISKTVCEVEVRAIQSKGIYVFTKHCVLNDQENGRYGVSTFANEQTIRELYLEGFEGSVKGGGYGVMTSFNRIGVVWSGAHHGLMTEVLRNEFGMTGMAITDCSMFCTYMDYRLGLLAGQNIWDGYTMGKMGDQLKGHESDPAIMSAMRESVHRIAYTIVNSFAMNGISQDSKVVLVTPWWESLLIALTVVFAVASAGSAVMLVLTIKKSKETNNQEE